MSTNLYKLVLKKTDGVVDLFNNTLVTPPSPVIATGSAGYIQNVSNDEVLLSNTANFDAYIVIGAKDDAPEISTLSFEAGDTVFLKTEARRTVLTIAIGA